MKLKVQRKVATSKSVIGDLTVNGVHECFTLEDIQRAVKVYGETGIPAGTYKVIIDYSNRFKQQMPLLLNVKNFEGVRIHPGNTNKDTHGCILVGYTKAVDFIGNSKKAYEALLKKMQYAISMGEEITIEIVDIPVVIKK
jgi:hypothetical protein